MFDLELKPHRRFDPLKCEWVLVSPHRTARPWQGKEETTSPLEQPSYDPACYLCPGNSRAEGVRNPEYRFPFIFDNDFPALLPSEELTDGREDGLLRIEPVSGVCRVVCFSPRHDLTLAGMDQTEVRKVVDVWAEQYVELGAIPAIRSVQIFENRGDTMGASNPHPHCQIWASSSIPNELLAEVRSQAEYFETNRQCMLCEYVRTESSVGERIVFEDEHFIAIVPFWAVWPFETLLMSKRHSTGFDQLSSGEKDSLSALLIDLTGTYDRLFETPFPYTMGFHQRPTDGGEHPSFHFHGHFYPPLLRSATVRKFMVGYEMLAESQRDLTPENAAERLRHSRSCNADHHICIDRMVSDATDF